MIFNIKKFFISIGIAILQSVIVFFFIEFIMTGDTHSPNGQVADFWCNSLTQFSSIVLIVNYRLIVSSRYFTWINILVLLITSYCSYIGYFIFSAHFNYSQSEATMQELVKFPQFYLSIFLVSSICFLADLGYSYFDLDFIDTPPNLLRKYIRVSCYEDYSLFINSLFYFL